MRRVATIRNARWRPLLLAIPASAALASVGLFTGLRASFSPSPNPGPTIALHGRLAPRTATAQATAPSEAGGISEVVALRGGGASRTDAASGGSADQVADLAGARLSAGKLDEAISELEKAVARGVVSARVENQLAVAYLERAQRDQPIDFLRALGAANRAAAADRSMPEPHYNRALLLQELGLSHVARRAWREVITADPDPYSKHQARVHLVELTTSAASERWEADRTELQRAAAAGDRAAVERIKAKWPEPARVLCEEELLPRWATELASGDEEAARRTLATVRAVAGALQRRGADRMLPEMVAAIDRTRAQGNAKRLHALVDAYATYGRALAAYKRRDLDSAQSEMSKAERAFTVAGTPMALWARHYIACCHYYRQELGAARSILEEIQSRLPADRYPALVARIHWIVGSMDILNGNPGESLAHFRTGKAMFQAANAVDSLSAMHQHLALALGALGDVDGAWREIHAGQQLAGAVIPIGRVVALLDEAGISALQMKEPEAALDLRDELVLVGRQTGDTTTIAMTTLARAQALAHLGRREEAERDLEVALELAPKGTPTLRERAEAEIGLVQAELELATQPATAIARTTRAIDFFAASDFNFYLPLAQLLRARARLAAGDEKGALNDYFASLRLIETTRATAPDPQLQIAFFDQSSTLFDEVLAVLAAPKSDPEVAFDMVERGRGRDLLERMTRTTARTGVPPARLSMEQIRVLMPPRALLVRYAVLPDRLLIWWLSRDAGGLVSVPVGERELAAQVEAARQDLRTGRPGRSIPSLRSLHRLLLAPVAAAVTAADPIVFVPDKALHRLPFAALVDPATQRYLVEDHAVTVEPSANVYARQLADERFRSREIPRSALVVGASRFNQARFPRLALLRGAEAEAVAVSALYTSSRLLVGDEATRERVLEGLAEAPDVIHVASHSLVHPIRPELSMLVLADDGRGANDGALYAADLESAHLTSTRLAVLSACDTAAGELSPSEGAMSLARPLLAAGVNAVVGSLWRVDDETTATLMIAFHEGIRAGENPIRALRDAQLESLHRGGPVAAPGSWASFVVVGGTAPTREETLR